jgi:hypothetical protein
VTAKQWAQYLSASLIWAIVPGVVGVFRVLRAEVRSS